MIKGIDVSEHNGTLKWDAVKADGIEFAMIRIGYGSNYESQDDRQAIRNMQECERLDIPYGAYLYSYALNTENVKSEAEHALRMVKDFNPSLGIYFDMEDADGYKARNGIVSEENGILLTDFCNVFMSEITTAGYTTGTYASQNYFENILSLDNSYSKWIASWGLDKCPVDWADIWQYTSDGNVAGNGLSRMDMNDYINVERFKELTAQDVHENGQVVENPIPEAPIPEAGTKYKIGDHVSYNRIYSSAGDWTDGMKPYFTDGVITEVYAGSRHPYLVDGGTGFIDDNCIVEEIKVNSEDNWIRTLQANIGAVEDGIAGPETLGKCPMLQNSSSGEVVRLLQVRLEEFGYGVGSCGCDGKFGGDTENAVRAFQKDNGLVVDGIVGKNTWTKLLKM